MEYSALRAKKKIQACIKSCIHRDQLMACDTMVSLFAMRYPECKHSVLRLQNDLQLARINIDHMHIVTEGVVVTAQVRKGILKWKR